jgi:hypothetical protein
MMALKKDKKAKRPFWKFKLDHIYAVGDGFLFFSLYCWGLNLGPCATSTRCTTKLHP